MTIEDMRKEREAVRRELASLCRRLAVCADRLNRPGRVNVARETATLLGVTLDTVYRWMRDDVASWPQANKLHGLRGVVEAFESEMED